MPSDLDLETRKGGGGQHISSPGNELEAGIVLQLLSVTRGRQIKTDPPVHLTCAKSRTHPPTGRRFFWFSPPL
jgi:hypothetical protein